MQSTLIRSVLTGLALALIAALPGHALTIADKPAYLSTGVPPLVMLAMTKDHQLFYKAYNDFTDLDGNGTVETTYDHSFNYYGYFDLNKCYKYDTSLNYFVPFATTATKYCTVGGNQWSGNFLNWGSMTRMDVLRKLLYGGTRSSDPTSTSSNTVLERTYLPMDAHAFAKFYNGSDINQLTPFTVATTAPTGTSTSSFSVSTGSKTFTTTMTGVAIGDQVRVARTSDSTKYMLGYVAAATSGTSVTITITTIGGAGGPYTDWTITDYSQTGISLCNTTYAPPGGTVKSQTLSTATFPPLIRVAKGNYALWSANERWQCAWFSERNHLQSGFGGIRSNGNDYAKSGLAASAENPNENTNNLLATGFAGPKSDYIARVKVCDSTVGLEANCKSYPSGNSKPTGLLQKYGDDATIKFGLMTGSYSKNISGGILRKNARDMTDEVNVLTNGTFTGTAGIVSTLNKMRLYGYTYDQGFFNTDDACDYQQLGIVTSGGGSGGNPANEGNCSSWGNPMSEVYLETLRYFAGKSPDSAFLPSTYTSSKDYTLGLPSATWTDPLTTANYCSPLNVILINASSASYDDDQMAKITDLGSASTAAALTKTVGDDEGITGGSYFIGDDGVTTTNSLCSGKTITDFGAIKGICPEAPSGKGTFLMAGAAWYAHTNKIRSDAVATAVPATDTASLKATTYAVQLASNTPSISIPVPGSATQTVTLIPAYRLVRTLGFGTGTIVDFKVVQPHTVVAGVGTGSFYVNWEDSNQGGDYDQDMWGLISYSITATTITVTTDAVSASTGNPQGFGYTISGTNKDGAHFHSGIYTFNYTDPTGVTGCTNCVVGDAATSVTYTIGTGSAKSLRDPLWYAAKWGGFVDFLSGLPLTGDKKPLLTSEWDIKTATGASGTDGNPDTYFYVTNPAQLENAMQNALFAILAESSASAVATNSTSLQSNSLVFQARFNSKDWSGQVLAYTISTAGVIGATAVWDAGQVINSQSATSRTILTLNQDDGKGLAFRWSDITGLTSTIQEDFLNKNSGGTVDGQGSLRVDYLRGDQTKEGVSSGNFRPRNTSRLGDITFSNPQYVGQPNDGYFGSTYATFRNSTIALGGYSDRIPMLYVGANDGMMHGFNACYPAGTGCAAADQGKELIAYMPGKVYNNLSKLTDQAYSHKFFVDGSPTVKDAYGVIGQCAAACWRSVLVSGLNAGGQGVFALDVTDPSQFSEANAAKLLLWEFTNADDADLGYTYSKPIIARLSNGKWAAIFGNGYNSTGGTAALYVLYLDKALGTAWVLGTNFFKIDTGSAGANGLSSIAGWDKDGDGNIDYVYGGDLQGNMWKFDISGTPTTPSGANWKVAFGGASPYNPLFTAVDLITPTPNRQPITTPPAVSAHPLYGMLVLFGTGKVLETADITDTKLQTFYAIWDKDDGSTVSARSDLLQQTITAENNVTGNRDTSANTMNWKTTTSTAPHYLGWYMDLVVVPPPTVANMKGERHVGTPKLINGVVFFNTYIPSTALCDFGGDGWLMAVNYATGGLLPFPPFDSDNSGSITSADTPTGGKKVGAAIGGTTIINNGGTGGIGVSSTTKGGTSSTPVQTQGLRGRVTWRELIQN